MQILDPEEAHRHGEALNGLRDSPGWAAFRAMLERHCSEVGKVALRDEDRGKEYYLGRLEAVEALLAETDLLVQGYREREGLDEDEEEGEDTRGDVIADVLSRPGDGQLA